MRDLYLWIRWRIGKDDAAFARLRHTHRAWFDYAPEEVNPKGAGIAQETVDVSGDTTPLWKMSMVVWCNALNTVFQACLAACMWGMNRFTRPSWTTGLFVAAACTCAGLGGWITYKEEQRRKKKQQSPV
jgi:phage terminase large subunit-like protein